MQQLIERQQHSTRRATEAELDLVIPAFNEERRIGATLPLSSRGARVPDWTFASWWWTTAASMPRPRWPAATSSSRVPVEIISCRTRGKGAAVRAGIQRPTAPSSATATPTCPPLRRPSDRGSTCSAPGGRWSSGHAGAPVRAMTSPREASAGWAASPSARWHPTLSGPITDTQCGFKLFHSEVAKELFASSTLTGSPSMSRCWPRPAGASTG